MTSNLVHCIFSTKGRADTIPDPPALARYLGGVAREKKIPLILAGGTTNHVHLLLALPAAMTLAKAMQDLRGNSSRWLGLQTSGFAWQDGYSAFSVSPPNKRAVMAYISGQERHHAKRSFESELISMLKKAEIDHDERYVFG